MNLSSARRSLSAIRWAAAVENTATTLSSAQTFPTKVLFPPAWVGAVTYRGLKGVLPTGAQHTDPFARWGFVIFVIAIAWVFWRTLVPLKRVRMDASGLYVSNCFTEIFVPLANIKAVSENSWDRNHPNSHYFPYWDRIRKRDSLHAQEPLVWSELSPHPVTGEIRSAVASATGKPPEAAA